LAGIRPGVLGNEDISWEKNTEQNIGIDAIFGKGMFNFRQIIIKRSLLTF
jgi:hypothetical protein